MRALSVFTMVVLLCAPALVQGQTPQPRLPKKVYCSKKEAAVQKCEERFSDKEDSFTRKQENCEDNCTQKQAKCERKAWLRDRHHEQERCGERGEDCLEKCSEKFSVEKYCAKQSRAVEKCEEKIAKAEEKAGTVCSRSKACASQGLCSLDSENWVCAARSDADCAKTPECASKGWCRYTRSDGCRPGSDAD